MDIPIVITKGTNLPIADPGYSLSKYKKTRGREGTGFTAEMWRRISRIEDRPEGGAQMTKVGDIADWGDGGGTYFLPTDRPSTDEQAILDAAVKATPPYRDAGWGFGPMEYSEELYLSMLGQDYEMVKTLTRKSKTHTAFLLEGEFADNGYRLVNAPWSPATKAYLMGVWDDQVITVWTPEGWTTKFQGGVL